MYDQTIIIAILTLILTINNGDIYLQNDIRSVQVKYLSTVINGKSQDKGEYLFRRPNLLASDSELNIYIVDYQGTEIRKYDKEGKYIKAFGRKGQGPGEFVNIASISIEDSKIIIRDAGRHQLVFYSTDGRYLFTQNYSKDISNVYNQWCYSEGRYLINKYPFDDKHQNMFYLYDGKNNVLTEFGHSSIFFDNKDVVYMHQRHRLNLKVINDDVYVVKKYYDGKLFKFDHAKKWEHFVSGPGPDAYKKYDIETNSLPTSDNYNNVIKFYDDKSNKHVKLLMRTTSAGLEIYKNKYILNFVVSFNNHSEKGDLGVEIYDINGRFIKYQKIMHKELLQKSVATRVFCMDAEGNFYILDREAETGVEVVKKFQITIE